MIPTARTICFILPEDEPYSASSGAIAIVTRELARVLRTLQTRTLVITPRFRSAAAYAADDVVSLRMTGDLPLLRRVPLAIVNRLRASQVPWRTRYVREVSRVLSKKRPDVVVVANDPPLARWLAARHPEVTIVLWLHNYLAGEAGRALRSLPQSVRVVAVSDSVRAWTAREYEMDSSRIDVIHNGVDLRRFTPIPTTTRAGQLRVVYSGRIDPTKGVILAAEAVALLREAGRQDVSLTIIGERRTFGVDDRVMDEYMVALEAALTRASATVTGWIPPEDVADLLRTFDVACVLSIVPEPFHMAGLEAMASGCAVVAVPLGGVTEWIGDAAIPVEPDAGSLASVLADLASDPVRLQAAKEASRAQAAAFGWEAVGGRLLELVARAGEPETTS